MSNLTIRANPSGTGTFIVESPNSNTNQTITLPDATTTLVGTDATQTLTNKTINGGALTLMTAQASTSGISIDFTGIPSWVKRVTVMFDGVSTSGTSGFLIQLGDSGGVETTGYVGSAMIQSNIFVTSSSGFSVAGNASYYTAASARTGAISIVNMTGNTWTATGSLYETGNGGWSWAFGGGKTLSATLDRVRITTLNGTDTFDAGTVNVMYEG